MCKLEHERREQSIRSFEVDCTHTTTAVLSNRICPEVASREGLAHHHLKTTTAGSIYSRSAALYGHLLKRFEGPRLQPKSLLKSAQVRDKTRPCTTTAARMAILTLISSPKRIHR